MSRFHTTITERGSFRTCRRQWDLDVNQRLAHKNKIPWNLIFGEAIHKGLESYYRNNRRDPVVAKRAFTKQWKIEQSNMLDLYGGLYDGNLSEEWETYLDKGQTMLTYYDIYDRKFPFWEEVLEVNIEERGFVDIVHPGGDQLEGLPILSGRIDLKVRRKDGIWIVDHKTAANAYEARALDVDDQLTGYAYIYWRTTGEVPRGVICNTLIKEPPKPPRILNDGSISKDKSQRTTYDLYLQTIRDNELDRANYTDILEFLYEKRWDQFFVRYAMERNIEELESFEERLYYEYEDMCRGMTYPEYLYPNPSQHNCGWCSFVPICQAMEEKGDVEFIKEEMYEVVPSRHKIPKAVLSEKWKGV